VNNIADDLQFIAIESLMMLTDNLKSCYTIREHPDVFNNGDLKVVNNDLKHFNIETHIGARHKALDVRSFVEQVAEPAIIKLADGINSLDGEYDFVKTLYDNKTSYCSMSDDGIYLTIINGYSMKFMVSVLSFNCTLIKSEE
jgi:hypothetical protein